MKVSIIICNYNYEKFLNQAIESAYNLNYANKEIIVVDDGSTDGSLEILSRWEAKVRVVYQKNGGQITAYNTGFALITGDLVIFLDSDDLLDADLLQIVTPYFKHQDVVKVHFKMRLIDESGDDIGTVIPTNLSSGQLSEPLIKKGWLYFSSPGSGNIYRASALSQLFPIPASANDKHGADFFYIYGVCLFGRVESVKQTLSGYRVHNMKKTAGQNNSLVFGNASKNTDELTRFKLRCERFTQWIALKTNNTVILPNILTDFSIVKQAFVRKIFEEKNYVKGFLAGVNLFPLLVKSIFMRIDFPLFKKIPLVIWALVVLILPRKLGFSLAAKVANPATR